MKKPLRLENGKITDGIVTRKYLMQILNDIAIGIESHRCPECAAHNEHEVCLAPDIAGVIRKAMRNN